jgi:ABC-type branched-subunit amino acid transport system substrate-binding protein
VKAGACTGFKNGPGMTNDTITIGNSSDISGPVPGLFTAAQQATRAYVEYFNKTQPNGICGRKLSLVTYDSRTDAGADQQAAQKICETSFAAVGSMGAFDSGGAATAQACGIPDIRTAAVTVARNECSTCFGVQATGKGEYQNEVYDYWIRTNKAATQKAAFLYLNAGAAAENGKNQIAVGKKRGMNWVYTAPIDVAEFNYGPYVQQMKSKGVQFVQFLGAYQQSATLAKAMQSAGFKPQVLMYDPSIYEPGFLKQAGSAADGAKFFVNFTPLNESQPELNLYKQWLQQVAPGAQPTFFGLFAWSAAKLFVEKSLQLGGKLTRASLVSAVRSTNGWTGGGAHSPMSVGSKHPPVCVRWMQVKNEQFASYTSKYVCGGYTRGS